MLAGKGSVTRIDLVAGAAVSDLIGFEIVAANSHPDRGSGGGGAFTHQQRLGSAIRDVCEPNATIEERHPVSLFRCRA